MVTKPQTPSVATTARRVAMATTRRVPMVILT
jgi:hypothetical protein